MLSRNLRARGWIVATLAVAVVSVNGALAAAISGNFCSVANVQNPPAGVVETSVWNNLTSTAGFGGFGSSSALLYEDNSAAGVTVSWAGSAGVSQNTNDSVDRSTDVDDGHDEMMTGYLQASKFGPAGYTPEITLEVTGIDLAAFGGAYDVILYFDGDGDIESTSGYASIEIDDGVTFQPTLYARDEGLQYALQNDGSDPLSVYSQITSTSSASPSVGNYAVFSGLTGTSFLATLTGIGSEHGVALNGFQIVPEPASWMLLGSGMLLAFRRR